MMHQPVDGDPAYSQKIDPVLPVLALSYAFAFHN